MIEILYKAALLLLGVAGMVAIVPLYVWGATGSWRAARHALWSYLRIVGSLAAVGAVAGLFMALGDWIG